MRHSQHTVLVLCLCGGLWSHACGCQSRLEFHLQPEEPVSALFTTKLCTNPRLFHIFLLRSFRRGKIKRSRAQSSGLPFVRAASSFHSVSWGKRYCSKQQKTKHQLLRTATAPHKPVTSVLKNPAVSSSLPCIIPQLSPKRQKPSSRAGAAVPWKILGACSPACVSQLLVLPGDSVTQVLEDAGVNGRYHSTLALRAHSASTAAWGRRRLAGPGLATFSVGPARNFPVSLSVPKIQ